VSSPRSPSQRLSPLVMHAAIAGLLALGLLIVGVSATQGIAVAAEPSSLSGRLLVATNELRDPRFVRTVVYMVRHGAGGAMGLIINRPLGEARLADVLERLGMEGKGISGEIRVHYGGPVEPTQGFVLHTRDYAIEGTHNVDERFAMTGQPEILRDIGAGTGPRRSLFALGYAGWAPGQLEGEIAAGAWVSVPADEALVFDEQYEKKWERAMARRVIIL